ncbi:trans-sulfuration enzyme family protein [Candidatus Bipolaricaulota bacterium]
MNDRFATKVVHAGEGKGKPYDAVTMPIVQTSTYAFAHTQEILSFLEMKEAGNRDRRDEYGRYSNPTQTAAERKIAALEGGESALLFATGMSAITTVLLALLSQGDHLVIASSTYRQTRNFVRDHLSRWGVEATFLKDGDADKLEECLRPTTRLILCEAPTNPYLRVIDLDHVSKVSKRHGITTAIDSTFATPVNLRPIEHGIDLVIHSATKYLGGHNDLLAGVVVGAQPQLEGIETLRGELGGVGSPHDAYLLLRGLKTLDLRIQRQNETGRQIAEYLSSHPRIRAVHYPGLESHQDHLIATRQMTGFGGVVSFEIDGDKDQTSRVIDRLRIPYIGPTLGGVESIAQQQAIFISLDPEERASSGISDSLIRYAAGIEDPEDLIADLDQALRESFVPDVSHR